MLNYQRVHGWFPIAMFDVLYLYVIVALIFARRTLVEGPFEVHMMAG